MDSFFSKLENSDDPGSTRDLVYSFLIDVGSPDNVSEDKIASEFWHRLADYYLKAENQEILDAVDSINLDGGLANMMCVFYRRILISDKAKKRYTENINAVNRCLGISFNKEELNRALNK